MSSKDTEYKVVHQVTDIESGIDLSNVSSMKVGNEVVAQAEDKSTTGNIEMKRAMSTQAIIQRTAIAEEEAKWNISAAKKMSDIWIQAQKRGSSSILPTIFPAPTPETPVQRKESAQKVIENLQSKSKHVAYTEHELSFIELSDYFKTEINVQDVKSSRGLSKTNADFMLHRFGQNRLTPPPRTPLWLLFLMQFTNLLMILLMGCGILSIVAYAIDPSAPLNLYLGLLLFIVVLVTCYETFAQEAKSDQLMEKFRAMVPEEALVIRDGILLPVQAEDLVVGDLIRLKSGDKIPADCRVIETSSMKVDQSMLTGESEPIESTVNAVDKNPLESQNIIFNGSLVVDGSCFAIVIRTGDQTLIGGMVGLTSDVGKSSSTLHRDIQRFVYDLTIFALIQGIIIFVVACARGYSPLYAFIIGFIVILIANVPQGLPSTITAALYIVAERMGKQNVFVKKLDVIETLGCCSVICTDKTGTLTLNLMSVSNVWVPGSTMTVDEVCEAKKATSSNSSSKSLQFLLNAASLNSRVVLERKTPDSELMPNGDATELGLYDFCSKEINDLIGQPIEDFRHFNPKIHEIPFNSSNKWQMSIHTMHNKTMVDNDHNQVMLVKGAPEVILAKCSHYIDQSGNVAKIDDAFTKMYTTVYEEFGGHGERVLGFSMKVLKQSLQEEEANDPKYKDNLKEALVGKGPSPPMNDLVFLGLITLMDPPRPEVPQAVADCRMAGIKVVMVTGDHPFTAAAIAKKIGLITMATREDVARAHGVDSSEVQNHEYDAVVVHGANISLLSDDDWLHIVNKKEIVFARTSPEQKLVIVKKFTEQGNVVAMTGDGVNDSPALKQAAIGIAMGKNGSDVAREAADVVLLDDNFASIVVGVREGRLLFNNLKKSIAYTLTHLVPQVIPCMLWSFFGAPVVMNSLQVLCIDLLSELAPAASFAYEPAESNIMQVPPRNIKTEKLVTYPLMFYSYFVAGFVECGICYLVFFWGLQHYGITASDYALMNSEYFVSPYGGKEYTNSNGRVYDKEEQLHILAVVQSMYYLSIVICQAIHQVQTRSEIISIFVHGLFCNLSAIAGGIIGIGCGLIVVYVPGITDVLQTNAPLSLIMFYGSLIAFGALFFLGESRKWCLRNYPSDSLVYKCLKW